VCVCVCVCAGVGCTLGGDPVSWPPMFPKCSIRVTVKPSTHAAQRASTLLSVSAFAFEEDALAACTCVMRVCDLCVVHARGVRVHACV